MSCHVLGPNSLLSATLPLTASPGEIVTFGFDPVAPGRHGGLGAGARSRKSNEAHTIRTKTVNSIWCPCLSSPLQGLPRSPETRIPKARPLTLSGGDIKHHSLHRHVDGLVFLESGRSSSEARARSPAVPAQVRGTSSPRGLVESSGGVQGESRSSPPRARAPPAPPPAQGRDHSQDRPQVTKYHNKPMALLFLKKSETAAVYADKD